MGLDDSDVDFAAAPACSLSATISMAVTRRCVVFEQGCAYVENINSGEWTKINDEEGYTLALYVQRPTPGFPGPAAPQ